MLNLSYGSKKVTGWWTVQANLSMLIFYAQCSWTHGIFLETKEYFFFGDLQLSFQSSPNFAAGK